jgi:type IV secretion system protein VirB8
MTDTLIKNAFEDEVFFTLRHQRNNWAKIAVGSVFSTILALGTLIVILPLNEVQPYVVMVDKTTGEAEKVVQVRPATLEQEDAVMQAELVSYVTDRETFDLADNKTRIPDVMSRSRDAAAETLAGQWSTGTPNYPPTLYGEDTTVRVVVKSISVTPASAKSPVQTARVRITKLREEKGRSTVERTYVATVQFEFRPNQEATLEQVWKNPLGFIVTGYRTDAETTGEAG